MDKALLDYEVSIDADCKLLTVGKPFAIEGTDTSTHTHTLVFITCEGPWLLFEASFLKNSLKGVEKHSCIHMHTPKLYKTVTFIHVVTHLEVH